MTNLVQSIGKMYVNGTPHVHFFQRFFRDIFTWI